MIKVNFPRVSSVPASTLPPIYHKYRFRNRRVTHNHVITDLSHPKEPHTPLCRTISDHIKLARPSLPRRPPVSTTLKTSSRYRHINFTTTISSSNWMPVYLMYSLLRAHSRPRSPCLSLVSETYSSTQHILDPHPPIHHTPLIPAAPPQQLIDDLCFTPRVLVTRGKKMHPLYQHTQLPIIYDVEISEVSDNLTDEEGRPSVVNNKMITSSRLAKHDPTQGHRMSSVPVLVLGNFLFDPWNVTKYTLRGIHYYVLFTLHVLRVGICWPRG